MSYQNDDIIKAYIAYKNGDSVANQFESVLDGEDLEDQNPAAIKLILECLKNLTAGSGTLPEYAKDYFENRFNGDPENLIVRAPRMTTRLHIDVIAGLVNSDVGGMVAKQFETLVDGDGVIDDLNPNAAYMIKDTLQQVSNLDGDLANFAQRVLEDHFDVPYKM